jgi:hypothetical protein
MSNPKTVSKSSALLDAIRNAPTKAAPAATQLPTAIPAAAPAPEKKAAARAGKIAMRGKGALVYLYEEDWKIIRELAAWLAGQGRRVNDSLVLRAALRIARPGESLLEAYEQATRSDKRFKKEKASLKRG